MNTKTLFKLVTMLAILMVLVAGNAFAGKWYVNVITGLDGYNGLSPTVGGIGVGPKATINNAITAATAGDTIYVDYGNGVLYNEAVVVNKAMVFGVTANNGSGTPVIFSLNINTGAAANNATLTGPWLVQSGLTLTTGTVINAGNLTVGTSVTRVVGTATVDAQINFTGNVDFTYNATMTTGGEMVAAGNTTNCRNITTTAGTLTLGHNVTMNGVLTTAGPMNLGANTLAVVGASVAHAIGGNVTNGTVAFTMSGATTVGGAFTMPTITAASSSSTIRLLTLTAVTTTGDLTASSAGSITATAATTVGNVTNSGTGVITLTAATATSSISNSSSGQIILNAAGAVTVTGNVNQSGKGNVLFNAGTSTTVTGSVTNNPTLTLTDAAVVAAGNVGVIRFVGDFPVTISGNLVVGTTITGATGSTGATAWANAGEVSFGTVTTLATVTGTVQITSTHSITYGGAANSVNNCAGVTFANTTGNISLGGITNSGVWLDVTSVTAAGNASLVAGARTSGTFSAGAVLNNSVVTTAGAHCNIITGAAGSTGANTATSVSTTGSSKGGQIYFAGDAATFTTTGTVNSARTTTGTYIRVGATPTAANAVSIGGDLTSSGSGTIAFDGFNGAAGEAFSVTGQLNVTGGTVTVNAAAALTGGGTFSFGTINISGGTVSLVGAGAATMNMVTGNATFTAGTFSMTTSAGRTLQLGGLANKFSGAATKTNFGTAAGNKLVTLLIQPTAVTALQTITGDATTTLWPGPITVNNTSGLQPAVRFTGGNFRSLGAAVTFTAGQVEINGVTLFIGGQLAPAIASGNFVNTAGYVTTAVGSNNGFISLNGVAAQTVSGAGTFGNFEADNNVGAGAVAVAGGTGAFTGTFNLTNGQVTGGANVVFNNSTNPPTIVVNAGTFAVAPTFTSMVNVYYIGIDKSTGNELPVAANKLNNLTVATTNGAITAGQGVVNVAVATTVNGNINVFPGQALLINGVTLTMKGAAITLNGDIANVAGADKLILAATAGTTITGAGVLPDLQVSAGSVGNMISGSVGLATHLLGADNVRSPLVDDINSGSTGSIVYAGGAASSLTVAFGAANSTTGAHFQTLTTAAGATFTLGANLTEHQSGSMTHAAGTIDVGAFTFAHKGAAPSFDGGASIIGTGKMQFLMMAATTLTITSSAATIAAPLEVSTSPSATPYTLTLAGFNLTASSTVTLAGTATFDVAAFNLIATGSAVTMGSGTAFAATGGVGVLRLNAAVAPLTFTYTGTPTIVNLRIDNDVVLAGTGTSLTVTGTFTHSAGNLNFGSRNLTAGGVYARTGAGTYTATTGYFIFSGTAFGQGNTSFDLPNLRFTNAGAVAATGSGVITVMMLDVNTAGGFTHTVSGAPTLTVADAGTVTWTAGTFDKQPTYVGTITFVASNPGAAVLPAELWPSTPTSLVTTFTVNGGGTTRLPGGRTVNSALKLTNGTLDLSTGTRTLTMVDNSTVYRTNLGFITVAPNGTLTYGLNMTVVYQANGAIASGEELPATIANLKTTRSANNVNAATTISAPGVTVTGLLTIQNNITALATAPVNAVGDVVIATESGTYSNATNPVVTINTLSFTGAVDQNFTLNGNRTVTNLTLNKTGGVVNAVGGNLTIGGLLNFVNGNLVIADPAVVILTQTLAGPGFTRSVVYPNASHVVGWVQHFIPAGQGVAGTNGRYEFPVGGAPTPTTPNYRSAAITFTGAYPSINPTNVMVKMVDGNPDGRTGLPLDGGNGVRIGNYPGYYWLMQTTPSSFTSTQAFDLDLQGTNLGYAFNQVNDLRIVRRQDGNATTNLWQLQGSPASYTSNYIQVVGVNNDSLIFVRSTSLSGSIVNQATRFTIGIPTRPPIWTVGQTTVTVNEGAAMSAQYTADPQDIGETITYALVSGPTGMAISAAGLLTWTPGYDQAGVKSVVISATDGQFTITQNISVTVINVNRAPVFAPKTASFTKTDKDTVKVTLAATDGDNDALTYSVGSITPAATNAPAVAGTQLTWKPTFADAGKTYTITAIVSDGVTTGQGPTPGRDTLTVTVVVNRSRALGDADGNGTVQAADASVVLQYVAGLTTVTDPAALWAMDASKNGTITAYDASLILQAAAGLIPPLTGTIEDAGLSKGTAMQATGMLEMASPEATTNPEVVKVGIKLSNPANVYSVALTTKGDFSLVSIDAVNSTLPEGWDMKWNVVGNELRIAAAGTTPLATGDVAAIMVHLKSKESRISFSTDAMLNENFQSLGAVEVAAIPTVYALDQNYPNPFNPSTTIRYQIPTDASVNLIIYNVQGQKIRTLVSKEQKAGYYNVVWDGRNEAGQTVSTGLYLYRVQAGSFVATQKMLMLK